MFLRLICMISKICLLCFMLSISLPNGTSKAADAAVDPQKPWSAKGSVVTETGEPIRDAEVIAHAGVGSLHMTGRTKSDENGKFELKFGPGVWYKNQEGVQAATISVHKEGWFETNLCRQGDLVAAHKLPEGEIGWGKKTVDDVFLPGKPKTLKFTLKPAAAISGVLRDSSGNPIPNIRVGVTGDELPPSSSVFAEVKTNEKGEFKFENLPTTYKLKVYFETKKNWRNWPSYTVLLREPKAFKVTVVQQQDSFEFTSVPPLEVLEQTSREKK